MFKSLSVLALVFYLTNGLPACDFIPDGTIPCSTSDIPLNVSSESAQDSWTVWLEVVDREILSKALKKAIKDGQGDDPMAKDIQVQVREPEVDDEALCRKASASFEIPETTYGKISIDMTTDLVDKDGDLDFRITVYNCNDVLTRGDKYLFKLFFGILQEFMALSLQVANCVFSNEDTSSCFALVE